MLCRKLSDFRTLRDYEEDKISAKAKWVLWPMRSWADDVISPDMTGPVSGCRGGQDKECKYSSAKSAEASARRRFASIYKEPEDDKSKDKKKAVAYSQVFTDSKGRILGERERGEAGAFAR